MISQEIKDFMLPACQTWLHAKAFENSEPPFHPDYSHNFQAVAEMEVDDARHMMKDYLQRVRKEHGQEVFNEAIEYCESLTTAILTKRTIVSVFKNAKSVEPVNIPLNAFLTSKRHYSSIEAIRNESDKAKRDELKKNLPCATISGVFEKRNIGGISIYNSLVCMDFDGKDNTKSPSEIKEILKGFDEVVYCGLSVGGNGVFAIVLTNNTDIKLHDKVVERLGEMFEKFELKHDKGCKDVSRLRFISHDTDGYFNENAIAFQVGSDILYNEAKPDKKHIEFVSQLGNDKTKEIVEKYVSVIQSQNIDITDNYEDWVKIGFSIAAQFGYDGEDYFTVISQNSPKYDYAQTAKKYEHFVKAGRRSGIGAFINICKKNNITI